MKIKEAIIAKANENIGPVIRSTIQGQATSSHL